MNEREAIIAKLQLHWLWANELFTPKEIDRIVMDLRYAQFAHEQLERLDRLDHLNGLKPALLRRKGDMKP